MLDLRRVIRRLPCLRRLTIQIQIKFQHVLILIAFGPCVLKTETIEQINGHTSVKTCIKHYLEAPKLSAMR